MDTYEKKQLMYKSSNYRLTFMNEIELRAELKNWCRRDIINWLSWNDSNGVYRDKESINEVGRIMTYEEGVEIMINQIIQQ